MGLVCRYSREKVLPCCRNRVWFRLPTGVGTCQAETISVSLRTIAAGTKQSLSIQGGHPETPFPGVAQEVVSNWTSAFITVLSDLSLTLDKLPAPFTDDRWLVRNTSSALGQSNSSVDGSVRGIRRDDLPWEEHSVGSIKGLAEQIKKRGSLEELEDRRGVYGAFGQAWYEILPIVVFGVVFASLLLRRSSVWLWWRRRTYSRGRGTPRAILPL